MLRRSWTNAIWQEIQVIGNLQFPKYPFTLIYLDHAQVLKNQSCRKIINQKEN